MDEVVSDLQRENRTLLVKLGDVTRELCGVYDRLKNEQEAVLAAKGELGLEPGSSTQTSTSWVGDAEDTAAGVRVREILLPLQMAQLTCVLCLTVNQKRYSN